MQSKAGQILCLCAYGQSKQVVLAGTRHGQVALWALNRPEPVKIFDMPSDAGIPLCLEYDLHNTFLCGTSGKRVVQWNMS